MSEIISIVRIRMRPGREQDGIDALRAALAPTHAEEGCLRYALHRSLEDPSLLVMVERWASQAALDAHLAQPYIEAVVARAPELFADHASEPFEPIVDGDAPEGRL